MTESDERIRSQFQELRRRDQQLAPDYDELMSRGKPALPPEATAPSAGARSKAWLAIPLGLAAATVLWMLRPQGAQPAPPTETLDQVCASALAALIDGTAPLGDVWRTSTDDLLDFRAGDSR